MNSCDLAIMKKDFQKVINSIRKDVGNDFPKAMMTGQQVVKRTATVNCGGEWKSPEYTKNLAEMVMRDSRFKDFLSKWGVTSAVEKNPFGGFQIRIFY